MGIYPLCPFLNSRSMGPRLCDKRVEEKRDTPEKNRLENIGFTFRGSLVNSQNRRLHFIQGDSQSNGCKAPKQVEFLFMFVSPYQQQEMQSA